MRHTGSTVTETTPIGNAEFRLGKKIVANMVMLGALSAITALVSYEALVGAVKGTVPKKTVKLNLAALKEGFQEGARLVAAAGSHWSGRRYP